MSQSAQTAQQKAAATAEGVAAKIESVLPPYDFPLVVSYARMAQIGILAVQFLILYSECDRLSWFGFLAPLIVNSAHVFNVAKRWQGAIDGRYDISQLLAVRQNTLRVQYAVAVLTAPICALVSLWFLPMEDDASFLAATFYGLFNYIKFAAAEGVFLLEAFEVAKQKAR